MLTAKQRELLLFIDQRLKANGISPSFDEMREALDLKSKSGVHRLISALEERGFIRRLANRARALEILKLPEVQSRLTDAGDQSADMTQEQLSAFLRDERQRWSSVIKSAGITAQ